jgi:hypothetical protein
MLRVNHPVNEQKLNISMISENLSNALQYDAKNGAENRNLLLTALYYSNQNGSRIPDFLSDTVYGIQYVNHPIRLHIAGNIIAASVRLRPSDITSAVS